MEKKVRDSVNDFYTDAANVPQEALCCAASYSAADVSHIPENVLEISYGCGSPISLAEVTPGEVLVDLGSGGGIDCFIAAKRVGGNGRVIGIDMTEKMLGIARAATPGVAEKLGFDVVEFKEGFLEEIPLEKETADIVTSNCVLNLSPDKGTVLKEIHRILRPAGRFCISDVVTEKELPEDFRNDKKLWGECLAGALTEKDFMSAAREAGFYGLHTVSRSLYRNINGLRFDSIVLNGYKFLSCSGAEHTGQYAIYNGPFKVVHDDDGFVYPVGIAVKVSTETVKKLNNAPYRGLFSIIGPNNQLQPEPSTEPNKCC